MAGKTLVGLAVICSLAVLASPAYGGRLITPGTVIFDMDTHTEFCDPDYWSFFGYPTVDFGSNGSESEDGNAVFTEGNWTMCDLIYGTRACQFLGAKHGNGRMCCGQPLCGGLGSGVRDADLDLSLGTGLTIRVRLLYIGEGEPGVRLQFGMVDTNGNAIDLDSDTTAVTPGSVPGKPYINRRVPLAEDEEWQTITIWFDGLDYSYDNSAIAGTDGLDLTDINGLKMIFRRGETSAGRNTILFDEFTLIDDIPVLWADEDEDGDVDLDDFGVFQVCFGVDPSENEDCARMDANFDKVIDIDDLSNFEECLQGPGVTEDFLPWCY